MSVLGWSGKALLPPVKSCLIGERVADRIEHGECIFQNLVNITPKWSNIFSSCEYERCLKWNNVLEDCQKQFKTFISDQPKTELITLRSGHKEILSNFSKLSEKYSKPKFKAGKPIFKYMNPRQIKFKWPKVVDKNGLCLKNFKKDEPLFVNLSKNLKCAYFKKNGMDLLGEHKRFNPIKTIQCAYHGSSETPRELPKLLYIQNPLVWATNKLDFRYLRTSWDPVFTEQEFTRGARQAISTITQLVSQNMFDSLKPLLTKNAMINLRRDVEILWADEVRRNVGLEPEDVQLIIPRKLHFRHHAEKKFCDIDVVFIGLKFLESRNSNPPLAFIDIIARFHRNYTDGIAPDWTVSAFKVRRFNVLPPK